MHLATDGTTPEFVDAALIMGRAAVKVEGHEAQLAALSRAVSLAHVFDGSYWGAPRFGQGECTDPHLVRCGEMVGEVAKKEDAVAKPLVSSRLNFPSNPSFDPRPYFDNSTRRLYDELLDLAKDLSDLGRPPNVQV